MGLFTESMTRLCGEIVAQRRHRQTFVLKLGRGVDAMLSGFAETRRQMARRAQAERQGFIKALAQEVASLRATFRLRREDMARRNKAERQAAVSRLKKSVNGWRREFVLDLAGAHRAWFGLAPAQRRTPASAEPRGQAAVAPPRPAPSVKAKEESVRPAASARVKQEAARPSRKKSGNL
jgi:hypothetical protein